MVVPEQRKPITELDGGDCFGIISDNIIGGGFAKYKVPEFFRIADKDCLVFNLRALELKFLNRDLLVS